MRATFEALAEEYGQEVVCFDESGRETGRGKAFFQPITQEKWQKTAGALGAYRTDRFLCLAPAGLSLGEPGDGGWVEQGGGQYEPIAVHPIYLGGEQTHWWAVLEPRDEAAV
jgi:hypothetical protein